MKIHADKIESPPPHPLGIGELKAILDAVPGDWLDGLHEVRLSNSLRSYHRAFFSRYDHTLTIQARGATPEHALQIILLELAAVHSGYARRHWHRLSAAEQTQLRNVVEPIAEQLLPIVIPKPRSMISTPTPTFRQVI